MRGRSGRGAEVTCHQAQLFFPAAAMNKGQAPTWWPSMARRLASSSPAAAPSAARFMASQACQVW